MPHLSPLNWALAPILFWFFLFLLSSIIWWNQSPSFPTNSSSSKFSFRPWNWK